MTLMAEVRQRNVRGPGIRGLALHTLVALAITGCELRPSVAGREGGNSAGNSAKADEGAVPQGEAVPETDGSSVVAPGKGRPDSIVQLLANPDQYHGRKVRVEGFLVVQFEGTAIYLCKEHREHLSSGNSLWVSFDEEAIPFDEWVGPTRFDRRYVLLEGTFNKNDHGHWGGWNGAIENVDRILVCRGDQPPVPEHPFDRTVRPQRRMPPDEVPRTKRENQSVTPSPKLDEQMEDPFEGGPTTESRQ